MLSHTIHICMNIGIQTYPNEYWNYIVGLCTLPKHEEEYSFPEYENINLKAARNLQSLGGCWLFPVMALARVTHYLILPMNTKCCHHLHAVFEQWKKFGRIMEKRFHCHISSNAHSFKLSFLYNMIYLWDSEGVGIWGNEIRKGLSKRTVGKLWPWWNLKI